MHSRIFVVIDKDGINKEDLFVPDYEDIQYFGDYVVESDDLEDDVEWLANVYKISVKKKDSRFFINRDEFIEALKEDRYERIKNAKKVLDSKPIELLTDADIYFANEYLSGKNSLMFIYNDHQYVDNSMYLLREMDNSTNANNEIEIVASYDYHC